MGQEITLKNQVSETYGASLSMSGRISILLQSTSNHNIVRPVLNQIHQLTYELY